MPGSTLFTDAMALTSAGDGVYDGELNEHWTIGQKVHGGAMLALCANAARTEHSRGQERSDLGDQGSGDVQPIAVSGNFLWAPDPGPMKVVTTLRKRGRSVSLIDVELRQGDRPGGERSREEQKVAVRAAITLGDPEHHVPPLLSVNPVIPLMQPEPPPGLEPIGAGHPMADVVHLAHGCDIRPSLTTFTPRTDGGPPIIEYWVRPKGVAPDVLFALSPSCAVGPVRRRVRAGDVRREPHRLGADGSTHRGSTHAARRRLVAGSVHDGADRPGLVRRGPHRRRLRGPHRRAEPSTRDGARAVIAGRVCNACAHGQNRDRRRWKYR
jgi:hypothetical protein